MIELPKLPDVGPDDTFLLDTMHTNAVNRYCIKLTIQLMEDPQRAIPEFLRLHDEYGATHAAFLPRVAMAVAGRLTEHIITRAPQADVKPFVDKLAYWIDGTKAVLSQGG